MGRHPEVRDFLEGPAGRARLAGAAAEVLAHVGAPTRPGGTPAVLAHRLAAGEPLADDTDWQAPLGPFRDTSIVRGTVGELLAARLTDGRSGLEAMTDALLGDAVDLLGPYLDALDPYDLRLRCRDLVVRAVGATSEVDLREVLGGTRPG